jgi:branched-chain amino acid transport system substrate-binding protein
MRDEACAAIVLMTLGVGMRAQSVAPYASIAREGESYAGAGRAAANDLKGKVVRIGMLAPLQGSRRAEGDAMVAAARIALQDAGGDALPGGRRVELAIRDSGGASWGVVSDAVIDLVMKDDVVAMITSTNGADAHLCEQVGNRMGVPVLTLAADATTTQIDIPWIFRMGASDVAEAQSFAQEVYRVQGFTKVTVIAAQDHDGRSGVAAMKLAAGSLGVAEPESIAMDPLRSDAEGVVKRMVAESPEAVVIWTGAETAEILLRAMKAAGVRAICLLPEDATEAGYGMNVWTVVSDGEGDLVRERFSRRFAQATGVAPNVAAMETYDAVTLTVRALRGVGANRARARDALAQVQKFDGAGGWVSFDREGNNTTTLHMVRRGDGRD